MSDSQQRQNQPHLLLTTSMIVLETIFTFIVNAIPLLHYKPKNLLNKKLQLKLIAMFHISTFMYSLMNMVFYLTPKPPRNL